MSSVRMYVRVPWVLGGCVFLACFGCVFTLKAYANDALTQAYKKEFAFLQAQKKALQLRLQEMKQRSERRVERAKRRILSMQSQILGGEHRQTSLQQRLQEVQRATAKVA